MSRRRVKKQHSVTGSGCWARPMPSRSSRRRVRGPVLAWTRFHYEMVLGLLSTTPSVLIAFSPFQRGVQP
jgi:hypothetical protein